MKYNYMITLTAGLFTVYNTKKKYSFVPDVLPWHRDLYT